jgi:hypothetical protein
MQFRELDALVTLGLLEPKPADPRRVRRWLERSRSDLALARNIVGRVDRDRAMAIAYEAGFRACAGCCFSRGVG